jgi:hypothetical protein
MFMIKSCKYMAQESLPHVIALLSALLLVLGRGRSDTPNNSAEVAQIQDCQLYLLRNDSVKGARECMFVVLSRPTSPAR